jgi:hypothetical protein
MLAKTLEAAPKGQTQRPAGRASLYLRQGTQIRTAVDRAAHLNAAIVQILRKSAKFPPELTHGLHEDQQ